MRRWQTNRARWTPVFYASRRDPGLMFELCFPYVSLSAESRMKGDCESELVAQNRRLRLGDHQDCRGRQLLNDRLARDPGDHHHHLILLQSPILLTRNGGSKGSSYLESVLTRPCTAQQRKPNVDCRTIGDRAQLRRTSVGMRYVRSFMSVYSCYWGILYRSLTYVLE